MTKSKYQILIIDSTTTRCEELCALWTDVLGYDVVFSEGGPFYRYEGTKKIEVSDLISNPPLACLFHQGDKHRYNNEEVKTLLDLCGRVVVFGGTGIVAKGSWPDHWSWIPRAIGGKRSAGISEWKQLAEWFIPNSILTADQIDLLHTLKRPHFLIAIHILCQGFLAGERMRKRVPNAVALTQTRDWWAVPLIKSAGADLLKIVTDEWGPHMPSSVARLVKWIANEAGSDVVDLATLVPEVKLEIENRIAK